MKKLFTFVLDKEVTEIQKETKKNDKGENVTTEKEIKKTVQQKVFLRKPNRNLFDEAELFYGVKLSEGIKAGLLTRALLAKRFSNDGGVLSEDEKDRYADLYLKLYETQLDTEKISGTIDSKRSPEDQDRLETLMRESADVRRELTNFEMAQSQLFEQTAENRARNKTILWWALMIAHFTNEDGSSVPVFAGSGFEERLASYDRIEDSDDEFNDLLLQKLIYYVSFWYVGRLSTQEEFEEMLKQTGDENVILEEDSAEKTDPESKEQGKEEPKVEEPKVEEPKVEEPKVEEPKVEKPKPEEAQKEQKNLKEELGGKIQEKQGVTK